MYNLFVTQLGIITRRGCVVYGALASAAPSAPKNTPTNFVFACMQGPTIRFAARTVYFWVYLYSYLSNLAVDTEPGAQKKICVRLRAAVYVSHISALYFLVVCVCLHYL